MKTCSSPRWLVLIVALQAVFLLSWAGYHEVVRHTAPTVKLKGLPVDPRDFLRGDYMTLNYEISRHATPAGWQQGRAEVYVVLKPQGAVQVIDEVLLDEPSSNDPRRWVVAQAYGDRFGDGKSMLRFDYGIERFFVPEGRGAPRFKTLEVEASISPTHRLYIKHIILDGALFP